MVAVCALSVLAGVQLGLYLADIYDDGTGEPLSLAIGVVMLTGAAMLAAWPYRRAASKPSIAHVALVVRDYDEAIRFFTGTLDFLLVEDRYEPDQNKRWVLVAPRGGGTDLLLARPSNAAQEAYIGNQTGGRVTFFLHTDDFERDYRRLTTRGVEFVRAPSDAAYGRVAVFKDLYGNLWDLIQPSRGARR